MDDVFTLLDQLENELLSAKNAVFSKKAMVDTQSCIQIISNIKAGLPASIKKSQKILDEAQDILNDSRKKAKEIIEESIVAPIQKDQKVGEIIYYAEDVEIGRVDVVTYYSVERIGLLDCITKVSDSFYKLCR